MMASAASPRRCRRARARRWSAHSSRQRRPIPSTACPASSPASSCRARAGSCSGRRRGPAPRALGPASAVPSGVVVSCSWIVGIARDGSMRRGATAELRHRRLRRRGRGGPTPSPMSDELGAEEPAARLEVPGASASARRSRECERAYPNVRWLPERCRRHVDLGVLVRARRRPLHPQFTFDQATEAVFLRPRRRPSI